MSSETDRNVRHKCSIFRVHYALPPLVARPHPAAMPHHLQLERYSRQVAGHREVGPTRYLGILKCNNGTILKPVIKPTQRREIDFYETMASTTHSDLVHLRKFINKYHGWKKFTYNGHESDYIILDDMAEGMLEPCIMDVKIGRRTWDPLASEEKIRSERGKYADCKRDVAFCVPGFQVYEIDTGKLVHFDKDYGKKLNGTTVRDAIRKYLNAGPQGLCRSLLLQILSELWRIQRWASRQTAVKLYSTSLLLVYDARRLRECCGDNDPLRINKSNCVPPTGLPMRRKSVHSQPTSEPHSASFSGQISTHGPIYRKISSAPTTPITLAQTSFINPPPGNTTWHQALQQLKKSHSFSHNYDIEISKAKLDYRALLEELSSESKPKPWVSVKIIDFVHAFFNEEEDLDHNFIEGIDNLVAIFEEFLRETDEQKVQFSA